jgi:hypothetical protein
MSTLTVLGSGVRVLGSVQGSRFGVLGSSFHPRSRPAEPGTLNPEP